MTSHAVHKRWLKVSALVIGFFGPALTLGTIPATNEFARFGLDILTWPVDGSRPMHPRKFDSFLL